MLQDFKFGLKLLWKQKAFTAAALLTLALCIGANTAIFTVLNAVVLKGLPFPEPDRLVTMYNIYPGVGVTDRGANGVPDYLDRKKMTDVFADVAIMGGNGYDVGVEGSPQRFNGAYVSPSYFNVLKVQPVLGRVFTPDEATEGKNKVVVLTEGLWKQLYAGDRNVLGKDMRLSGVPYRIIGVLPQNLSSLDPDTRLIVPFAFTAKQMSDDARHSNNWGMIARLQPGVTIEYAKQRLDALNKQNLDRFPKYRDLLISARFGTKIVGLKDEYTRDIRSILYLLQAAVGAVLLIGCVNLANLMLVRSNVRMKEVAIRFSLGASRWRLSRQLLTESVTIAVIGGALGVGVADLGVRLLSYLGAKDLPRGDSIHIDPGVLGFTIAVAVLTGLIFGAVPIFHLFKRDLNEVFRGNERGGTSGHRAVWLRSALVVCQVSLAFVLLIGAGLLTMSFSKLLTVSPGFRPDNVTTAQFSLPGTRYKEDAPARNFIASFIDRLHTIPGVRRVGITTYLPFSGNNNSSVITIEGKPLAKGEVPPVPGWNTVNGEYFAAMGIPLQQGRVFSDSDTPDGMKVAVIDQFLARKYWPNGDAIGHRIRKGVEDKDTLVTIVGIVGEVKTNDLADKNPVGQIYFPYQQDVPRGAHIVVRSDRDDPQVTSAIRRELLQADSELPLFDTKSMPQRLSASLMNRRAAMILCLAFAGLALLLAAIGIYGVLAYSVAQRTREIGIRVALGADATNVLNMIVQQGLRMAGIGLLIGAVCAFLVTRLMSTLLYDVKSSDPVVYLAVAFVLALVAVSASLIPSLRALRIRPAVALRYE